jgi:hypothetical protein
MNRQEKLKDFYWIEAGTEGEAFVNEIYDDLESRSCINCKFSYIKTFCEHLYCKLEILSPHLSDAKKVLCHEWEKE